MVKVVVKNQAGAVIHDLYRGDSQDMAQAWINSCIDNKTFPDDSAFSIEDVALEMTKDAAKQYLLDTDWMIIRQIDSGVPMPDDIKQQRAAARLIINPKV